MAKASRVISRWHVPRVPERAATGPLHAVVAAALVFVCIFALPSCTAQQTPDPAVLAEHREQSIQTIRDGISSELNALKSLTPESYDELMNDVDTGGLASSESYGVNTYDLLSHLLARFDYSVGAIQIDGNHATAHIAVTNVNISQAMSQVMNQVVEEGNRDDMGSFYHGGDDAALIGRVLELLYANINDSQDLTTKELDVSLTKEGSDWSIDQTSREQIVSAAFGDLI